MIFFVTAIGTDSGKTLISAIFSEALGADYWKPVQSGQPKDSDTVKVLVSKKITVHPETYCLNTPASPHVAAKIDGISISLEKFSIPNYKDHLIIEGAGGLLVPLNEEDKIADLIVKLNVPVILVVNLYLGCINHSLLTIEALKIRKITIAALVFNGDPNKESEQQIKKHANTKQVFHVGNEKNVDVEMVKRNAAKLLKKIKSETWGWKI
ncbi:MAG: dethiobiotin synthase [Bacteroidota bacterium]|nr:dethiobiotin synthase [Bacteroidota bacterium]